MTSDSMFKEFVAYADQLFVCLSASCAGVKRIRNQFEDLRPDTTQKLYFGATPPDKGIEVPGMNAGDFLEYSKADGVFTDLLSKSIIVTVYSSWDEYYRHKIAELAGVKRNCVRNEIMGDLRHIRNCVVHSNSKITNEKEKIKYLGWMLGSGELSLSRDMMEKLSLQIRTSAIEIHEDA